jgi:hypothetical protein
MGYGHVRKKRVGGVVEYGSVYCEFAAVAVIGIRA